MEKKKASGEILACTKMAVAHWEKLSAAKPPLRHGQSHVEINIIKQVSAIGRFMYSVSYISRIPDQSMPMDHATSSETGCESNYVITF